MLVGELGIEPSAWLTELHGAILRHDPLARRRSGADVAQPAPRSILVAALALERARTASPRSPRRSPGEPSRELLLADDGRDGRGARPRALRVQRRSARGSVADGVEARAAVFTSVAPGVDIARLAREHDVDLLLVDAPDGLLEDARVLVAARPGALRRRRRRRDGASAPGRWSCRSPGPSTTGRRSSSAPGSPVLAATALLLAGRDRRRRRARREPAPRERVDRRPARARRPGRAACSSSPTPAALVDAAADAGVVVVGLTDRWRREGLGRARTALATQTRDADACSCGAASAPAASPRARARRGSPGRSPADGRPSAPRQAASAFRHG